MRIRPLWGIDRKELLKHIHIFTHIHILSFIYLHRSYVHAIRSQSLKNGWTKQNHTVLPVFKLIIITAASLSGLVAEWLGSRTCDQQVAGSYSGHRAAECNPGQVGYTRDTCASVTKQSGTGQWAVLLGGWNRGPSGK